MSRLLRISQEPITEHDYTRPCWGHALHDPKIEELEIRPVWWRRLLGEKPEHVSSLRCLGHGYDIEPDHTILLSMKSGKAARFRVREIEYYLNPPDMFDLKRADFEGYIE